MATSAAQLARSFARVSDFQEWMNHSTHSELHQTRLVMQGALKEAGPVRTTATEHVRMCLGMLRKFLSRT